MDHKSGALAANFKFLPLAREKLIIKKLKKNRLWIVFGSYLCTKAEFQDSPRQRYFYASELLNETPYAPFLFILWALEGGATCFECTTSSIIATSVQYLPGRSGRKFVRI